MTFQLSAPPPALVADAPTRQALVVDADGELAARLAVCLGAGGWSVGLADSIDAARERIRSTPCDALVLEQKLPDGSGLDLLRELRSRSATRRMPLLMLGQRADSCDRVLGLELGADDYLAKPVVAQEVVARVNALWRRARADLGLESVLRFGRLEVDLGARQVRLDGILRALTGRQFELLSLLAQCAGRVLSRDQIMASLNGCAAQRLDRRIDVHVSRIRAEIEDDPRRPARLLTVRGGGYTLARA
ncbi:MAG: response regulator transcription factor [Burkholderiales bacterium]|nr:response regulator transcription factor [Burkholderiales bacterium]MDE2455354.1 response regulator transcription factor [Burkholderiales bacterium]